MSINGFYAGYFTGLGGNSVVLLALRDGTLAGVDMGAVLFDGNYSPDGEGSFSGVVKVTVPPGVTTIQGVTAPDHGLSYEIPIKIPENFLAQPFLEILTPFGKVNARMQKLRDFPND